jgi:hypothetical protein
MADKWGRRLFKTGAMWLVLLGLVHGISLLQKPAPVNDTERQLLDLMTGYKFNLLGSFRSMDNLLRGFSITFMLGALVTGALALLLSGERAALLKRVALVNTIWLILVLAVSLHYFFIIPTSFLAVALLLFALAWLKLPSSEA